MSGCHMEAEKWDSWDGRGKMCSGLVSVMDRVRAAVMRAASVLVCEKQD